MPPRPSRGVLPLALAAGVAACAPQSAAAPADGTQAQGRTAAATPSSAPSGTLVVANQEGASAWLIDVASGEVVARLATGEGPHEVAVSPDGRRAAVTDYGTRAVVGGSLTLIDIPGRRVAGKVSLAPYRRPHGVAWLPDGRRVAVTSEVDSAVVIVDVDAGRVEGAIRTGAAGSHMLALSADGRRVYTANIPSGTITGMDVERRAATGTAPAGRISEGLALSPDGREVWVGNRGDNTVSVIDTRTMQAVATLPAAQVPYRVAVTPDGTHALVANPASNLVRVFDRAGRREARTIELVYPAGDAVAGARGEPLGLIVTPDSRFLFTTDGSAPRVALVELATGRVLRSYPAGPSPDGIAYSPVVVR